MHLNEDNFIILAAKHYENTCLEEFYDDLKRFNYIRRLLNKYKNTGEIKERLILNHIIILFNVFGLAATKMIWFKTENYHSQIKPFLVLLGYMPNIIHGLEKDPIYTSDVPMDPVIVEALRKL